MRELMHEIPVLDRKGLREFGLVTGGIVIGLFGVVLPWLLGLSYPLWPWIVGGGLGVWALTAPGPVYRLWMRFGLIMSRITTPLILGIVFFLVFAPVALVLKVLRRDPMARRFDEQLTSYRVVSRKPPKDHLKRPF